MPTKDKVETKRGRKPMPIDYNKVEQLAAQGLSETQIALVLGINWKTLAKRKKDCEKFQAILEQGKAKGIAKVVNATFNNALTGNFQAQQFFLRTRDPENWSVPKETVNNDTLESLTKLVETLGVSLPN